jgi:hypothetical protein
METKAVEQYNKHLERLRNYNSKNKDKLNVMAKQYYYDKIKSDPEKYKEYLEKRKLYQKNQRLLKKKSIIPLEQTLEQTLGI